MIKTGIIGGASKAAGELIKILINHPDVTLKWVSSQEHDGERIDMVHRRLTGETSLAFASSPDLGRTDVVIVCDAAEAQRLLVGELPGEMRIINLVPQFTLEGRYWVYGLSECNRKFMVRECDSVDCPSPAAMAISLAVLPMARNLMVNSDIVVHAPACDATSVAREVGYAITNLQTSFSSKINIVEQPQPAGRGLVVKAYIETGVAIDVLRKLYDDYYDDHNFVTVVDYEPTVDDVVHTNKCLLHMEREGGKLVVTAVIDAVLKGGIGNAVHCLNLLFGLYERTGLKL